MSSPPVSTRIVYSNPTRGNNVCLLLFHIYGVLSRYWLCDGLNPRPRSLTNYL
jgi:hypothetical protein